MIEKLQQQLKTAKEENEKLKMDKEHYFKESAEFFAQKTILGEANDTKLEIIKTLTQQNKQMRECLNEILKVFADKHSVNGYEHTTLTIVRNVLQTLKGWE